MIYTWDQPSACLPAQLSFIILLPARHEEAVIQTTIEQVVQAN